MLTYETPSEAFATAKLRATRGRSEWLVWHEGTRWAIARRTLDNLEAARGKPNLTAVDRRGWLHRLSPARVELEVRNMRAGFV